MKSIHPTLAKWLGQTSKLVQAGRLKEATAAIQNALRGQQPTGRDGAAPSAAQPMVFEGLVRELRPGPASAPAGSTAPASAAPAGEFSAHSHTGPTGTRAYKLFVPRGFEGKTLPMIVMLHGCTQNPDDFAAGTRMNEVAQEQGFLVLYPAQAQRSNTSKCWNWFQPADQRRGGGEPALLADMTRHILATQSVDPERVYIAGLSAGGAMAAIMGREYPDLFAAIGVHSGLPHAAAHDVASAFAAMKGNAGKSRRRPDTASADGVFHVPAIVFHGDADATVHPRNGQQVIDDVLSTSSGSSSPRTSSDSAGGRRYTRAVYADDQGRPHAEHWEVHGGGHAWSGGSNAGSYTDAQGPDASREMLRFFMLQRRASRQR